MALEQRLAGGELELVRNYLEEGESLAREVGFFAGGFPETAEQIKADIKAAMLKVATVAIIPPMAEEYAVFERDAS